MAEQKTAFHNLLGNLIVADGNKTRIIITNYDFYRWRQAQPFPPYKMGRYKAVN